MKFSHSLLVFLIIFLLVSPLFISARRINRSRSHHSHHHLPTKSRTRDGETSVKPAAFDDIEEKGTMTMRSSRVNKQGPDTLQIAGSRLPDCSHACGSCSPCRLVMVSFVCSSIEEAETCPMAYKCMCHHKSYPVP